MGKKRKLKLCQKCGKGCEESCEALRQLRKTYREIRIEQKEKIIKRLRKELEIRDSEVADDLRELGEKVIDKIPDLIDIRLFDIRVGYVRCYYPKKEKGKDILADCKKVNMTYAAYLPYDFVITFYEPNIIHMTENQIKILMLHELKHIKIGPRGTAIEEHDIEDFQSILKEHGLDWNGYNEDVIDICS